MTGYVIRRVYMIAGLIFSGILCALLLGLWRFKGLVQREVETLLAQATTTPEGEVVTEDMLQDVPEPVQRYLRYTGILGKPKVNTVRLEQKGSMYLGVKQGWVLLRAQEHYTVQPPGFVWDATIHRGHYR